MVRGDDDVRTVAEAERVEGGKQEADVAVDVANGLPCLRRADAIAMLRFVRLGSPRGDHVRVQRRKHVLPDDAIRPALKAIERGGVAVGWRRAEQRRDGSR